MSDQKYVKVEVEREHPLEDFFGISPGTTIVETTQKQELTTVPVITETYDDKDKEIEQMFENVYDVAMETFHDTIEQTEDIEPKYRNKAKEVAAIFLNTALAAADKKAVMKSNKDKLEHKTSTKNFTQNNLIFDRNELLASLKKPKTIDHNPE